MCKFAEFHSTVDMYSMFNSVQLCIETEKNRYRLSGNKIKKLKLLDNKKSSASFLA